MDSVFKSLNCAKVFSNSSFVVGSRFCMRENSKLLAYGLVDAFRLYDTHEFSLKKT